MRKALPFAVLVALAIPACVDAVDTSKAQVDAGPSGPPRICRMPGAADAAWFEDATADFGLAPTDALAPAGGALFAADLDGDGFDDFISVAGAGDRPMKQVSFLYLNRPDPKDSSRRIFFESLGDSGLQTTRDGMGNRGFGSASLGDLDDDGDVDAVLCPSWLGADGKVPKDPCDAFLNDGHAHFTLAPPSDLDAKSYVTPGGALLDYDLDGVLDFWPSSLARWPYGGIPSQYPTLYRGGGDGRFQNVSAAVGLPTKLGKLADDTQIRPFFGVTACDLDGDGDDDMVLATYGREENWVFRNDGGHFVEVGRELGLAHDDNEDYSDDQSYRCYCKANPGAADCMPAPPAPSVPCNEFGNPYFRGWGPQSETSAMLGGNNFSFACNDIDDDGDMDLMSATITHGDVGGSSDPSELILNPGDGTKFQRPGNVATGLDRPENGIYWNHGDDMAVFVDIDRDGRKDIFLTTTGAYPNSRSWLWRQKDDQRFEEVGVVAGLDKSVNYHNPIFLDVDGDGDLDLIAGDTATGALHAFRNRIGQDQNGLRIQLVGKGAGGANRNGIGAKVTVKAGGRAFVQELQSSFGHGGVEQGLALTFGLGSACDIESIEVRWPNANRDVTTYTDVRSNYAITLVEGDSEVHYAE